MRRRSWLSLFLVAVAGCNSGGSTVTPMADMTASMPDMAMPAPKPDMAMARPDMATPPQPGTRVAQGNFVVDGVTDDGYVLVHDDSGYSVVNAANGTAKQIATTTDVSVGFVIHKVAFVFVDPDLFGNGALTIWTAAGGAKEVSAASPYYFAEAAADSSYVAYLDNLQQDGEIGDIVVDKPDHSSPKKVAAGIDLLDCFPTSGFVGARFVSSHCAPGMTTGEVTSYDPATGQGVALLANAASTWTADAAGTKVLVKDDKDAASIVPVGGGPAQALTGSLATGWFSPDGNAVIYRTTGKGLSRIAAGGGMPTVLQAGAVATLRALSPDGKWVAYHNSRDGQTGFYDYFLASGESAQAKQTLSADPTVALYGPAFTDDSAFAVFGVDIDPDLEIGPLVAQPVAGGQRVMLGDGMWQWFNAGGARVVWTDNYVDNGMSVTTDLELADLAKGGAATKLAPQVQPYFAVSSDKKNVFYSVENDGLYRLALP